MKSTPSSARRMTRSVLSAVVPTYCPTRPDRSTSTRWPRFNRPIARYIWARRRATVVLPVPGSPRKTRCCDVATSGSPCFSGSAWTWRNATSARTCSLTVSRPVSASSSAWSAASDSAGSGLRNASASGSVSHSGASPPAERRSPITRSPRATSSSGFLGISRQVTPQGNAGNCRFVNLVNDMATTLAVHETTELANRLRPVLLKLARELRREIHSLGVTGGQVSLLVQIKYSPGIGIRELAARERISVPGMSKFVSRLEDAGLVQRAPVEGDQRRVGLSLTAAGHKVLRSVKSKRTAWLAARLRHLEPEQLEAIDAAIEPLAHLLELDAESA